MTILTAIFHGRMRLHRIKYREITLFVGNNQVEDQVVTSDIPVRILHWHAHKCIHAHHKNDRSDSIPKDEGATVTRVSSSGEAAMTVTVDMRPENVGRGGIA